MSEHDIAPETLSDEEESLSEPWGLGRVEQVVARELGADAAQAFARIWRTQDAFEARRHPGEGLRERKKRLTRQRISDVATTLFVSRGFDHVRVAEVAEAVGVSEKTVYNYFPTKESLVFDQADEQLESFAAALRDRPAGTSPLSALLDTLGGEGQVLFETMGEDAAPFLPAFGEMMRGTPALRAAWAEHRDRLVDLVVSILAEESGADPRDPEPMIAGRALVSLVDVFYEFAMRHVAGDAGEERDSRPLGVKLHDDLARAARVIQEGLASGWSSPTG